MSSATFFSGVFGGAGGEGRGILHDLLNFFSLSREFGCILTLSLITPSYLEKELIQHTSDRSEIECIFESLYVNTRA